MSKILLKSALIVGLLSATASFAQAQKFGDNLGNHIATKNLEMNNNQILNASGIVIGSATPLTNTSIALQIGAGKALVISSVADPVTLDAVEGMIVYNTTSTQFEAYKGGSWSPISTPLRNSPDGIETAANNNGYTLTQTGQDLVLRLAPADETHPGIVTTGVQTFGGNKTFGGSATVTNGLEVIGGATTLGGNLAVATATILNGTLNVVGKTTLAGADAAGVVPAIEMTGLVAATTTEAQNYLVVDAQGNVKKGESSIAKLGKYSRPLPAATTDFDPEGNSAATYNIEVLGIKKNDAVVVNFDADQFADFAGLTILSAAATADDNVRVVIADLRNPAISYSAPVITGKNLIITKYNPGQ